SPHVSCSASATPEIYPLSLHDALPIFGREGAALDVEGRAQRLHDRLGGHGDLEQPLLLDEDDREFIATDARHRVVCAHEARQPGDRKSTRLNSSHVKISYAVFCLKKKT